MSLTSADREEITEIVRALVEQRTSQSNAATKSDIADVRSAIADVKADLAQTRADLRREIAEAKTDVIKWYVATMGVFAALYSAINLVALKLMRP